MTDPSRDAFKKWQIQDRRNRIPEIQNWTDEQILDLVRDSSDREWEIWQAAMAHKEADAWQPINTAPRDGTTLLLRSAKGRIASGDFGQPIGWANPKCWIWPYLNQEPTHWQPLPAAPLPQGE